jgi:hypothetical protein
LIQYSTWYIFFVFSSDLKLLYGPDQFEENDPNEAKALAIFFNRLFAGGWAWWSCSRLM